MVLCRTSDWTIAACLASKLFFIIRKRHAVLGAPIMTRAEDARPKAVAWLRVRVRVRRQS